LARGTTGWNRSIDSAIDALMFFWLKVSEAAVNTAIPCTRASSARSSPFSFGTSAEYRTPSFRRMPAKTSAASASCGTQVGDTNALTSMSW